MSILVHQRYGQGEPLVVLHGLFGSADNWRTLARQWSEERSVWCLDLRNHGRSFHSSGMSYTAQAEDVLRWMDHVDLERVSLLGHSMGGKVSMELALRYPGRIKKLILADIAPVSYPDHSHASILQGLRALQDNEPWHERRQADQLLAQYVDDVQTRLFLLTNLVRGEQGLGLRIGLKAIEDDYPLIIGAPPAAEAGRVFEGPALSLRGTRSDYVTDEQLPLFRQTFPQLQVIDLDAGHWLHAEQAPAFGRAVTDFLKD